MPFILCIIFAFQPSTSTGLYAQNYGEKCEDQLNYECVASSKEMLKQVKIFLLEESDNEKLCSENVEDFKEHEESKNPSTYLEDSSLNQNYDLHVSTYLILQNHLFSFHFIIILCSMFCRFF